MRSLILLSGGLDSAVALAQERDLFPQREVRALFLDRFHELRPEQR